MACNGSFGGDTLLRLPAGFTHHALQMSEDMLFGCGAVQRSKGCPDTLRLAGEQIIPQYFKLIRLLASCACLCVLFIECAYFISLIEMSIKIML